MDTFIWRKIFLPSCYQHKRYIISWDKIFFSRINQCLISQICNIEVSYSFSMLWKTKIARWDLALQLYEKLNALFNPQSIFEHVIIPFFNSIICNLNDTDFHSRLWSMCKNCNSPHSYYCFFRSCIGDVVFLKEILKSSLKD